MADREGNVADIVLGHDDLAPYEAHRRYFGAAIGRYANRIAGGRFTLDGVPCHVPANNGANALHGGPDGFDRRLWSVEALADEPVPSVTLGLVSPDGDQGFPASLDVRVTYALDRPPRIVHRLRGDDEPADARQPHPSRLLQPRRRRDGRRRARP